MADKKSGLGFGLEAILGEGYYGIDNLTVVDEETKDVGEIELDKIIPNPYQPRKVFAQEELQELADSIKEHGVFTPILVKKTDTGYVLIAGERRFRASKLAGLTTIPAIVKDFTDAQMMELSILENIQREDLTSIEEAKAYKQLVDKFGYTQEVLAERLHKSRTYVTNILRLLNLPEEIQDMVIKKELTMGQVRPLITIEDKNEQIRLANMIQKLDLSARQAEMLAKKSNNPETTKKEKEEVDPELIKVQRRIQSRLSTKVKIKPNEISIAYKDVDDLNRILETLNLLDD